MSDQNLKLTYEQLGYIMEKTNMKDPKSAIEYFAEIMKAEGIRPSKMPLVVFKLMERERRLK